MPVEVKWYDEAHTIIHYQFIGMWTASELHQAIDKVTVMLEEKPARLDLISDMSLSKGTAKGDSGSSMQAAISRSYNILPESFRYAVVTGGGRLVDAMINISARIYAPLRHHVKTASSIEEALALIEADRGVPVTSL